METEIKAAEYLLTYKKRKMTDGLSIESHCHAQYEMIAVLEGEVSIVSNGNQSSLSGGDMIIIPPLVYHTVKANGDVDYRRVTLLFDICAVPPVLRERFLARTAEVHATSFCDLTALKKYAPLAEKPLYRPLIESILIQLFYAYTESKAGVNRNIVDAFLQRTAEYIDEHLCEKMVLDDLALHAARSQSSLCHLFKKKMGISVKQYVLEKRMALASKMLREGIPPTDVATAIGYENYSNFYRIYQKHFGLAPSKEKKRR